MYIYQRFLATVLAMGVFHAYFGQFSKISISAEAAASSYSNNQSISAKIADVPKILDLMASLVRMDDDAKDNFIKSVLAKQRSGLEHKLAGEIAIELYPNNFNSDVLERALWEQCFKTIEAAQQDTNYLFNDRVVILPNWILPQANLDTPLKFITAEATDEVAAMYTKMARLLVVLTANNFARGNISAEFSDMITNILNDFSITVISIQQGNAVDGSELENHIRQVNNLVVENSNARNISRNIRKH
ncbi:MAG: hypothetical protein AAF153_00640 [Pseudomonadota bacterium]